MPNAVRKTISLPPDLARAAEQMAQAESLLSRRKESP